MDHAIDLLGGLPVDEFLNKMKESRHEVQIQTAQSLEAKKSTSSFYFLTQENASCSALNEILALKLSLFYEVVSCVNNDGVEIARGLINYDNKESQLIKGKSSDNFEAALGYIDEAELIHRDNLVLL